MDLIRPGVEDSVLMMKRSSKEYKQIGSPLFEDGSSMRAHSVGGRNG